MLDKYHRAAYILHHGLLTEHFSERRVYYVIAEVTPGEFLALSVKCAPNMPKRELPDGLSHLPNLQYFTARGRDIQRMPENAGRYSDDSEKLITNVSLAPCLADVA